MRLGLLHPFPKFIMFVADLRRLLAKCLTQARWQFANRYNPFLVISFRLEYFCHNYYERGGQFLVGCTIDNVHTDDADALHLTMTLN